MIKHIKWLITEDDSLDEDEIKYKKEEVVEKVSQKIILEDHH